MLELPQELLQRRPADAPNDELATREDFEDPARDPLVCRICGHTVTFDSARIEIGGRHLHRRTNPEQIDFEFAGFAEAPGAARVGEATAVHSWFPGYLWRYAVCRRCGCHLGWAFDGSDPAFWGLITSRLASAD